MLPNYWLEFVKQHNLIGLNIEIKEEDDLSGLGIEMKIMTEKACKEESEEAYPGKIVRKNGYIPIGSCLIGSGDPYFINENDGKNGPVYRIYHDSVDDENYDKNEAIEKVLDSYNKMIKHIIA